MDDDKSNKVASLTGLDPGDRVKKIQDLQRRSSDALPAAGAHTGDADPVGTAFQAAPVQRLGTDLGAGPPTGREQAAYAKAQAGHAHLFSSGDEPEMLGNPWREIDF